MPLFGKVQPPKAGNEGAAGAASAVVFDFVSALLAVDPTAG